MAIASLIVSIIAIVFAAGSLWYSGVQARLNRDRRHDELAPVLQAEFVDKGNSIETVHEVLLRNDGPLDLTRVEVRVIDPPPGRGSRTPTVAHLVVSDAGGKATFVERMTLDRPLRRGETQVIYVTSPNHRIAKGQARIECRCTVKHHKPWTVIVSFNIGGQ
jgi:hypothetical protein